LLLPQLAAANRRSQAAGAADLLHTPAMARLALRQLLLLLLLLPCQSCNCRSSSCCASLQLLFLLKLLFDQQPRVVKPLLTVRPTW
jgi:hypothetical protein